MADALGANRLDWRVVAFAIRGRVTGELPGISRPALAMAAVADERESRRRSIFRRAGTPERRDVLPTRIKLGKTGRSAFLQGVLRQLGIAPDATRLVEVTEDDAVVVRQVSVQPVAAYSDEPLAEFAPENTVARAQTGRPKPLADPFQSWAPGPRKRALR